MLNTQTKPSCRERIYSEETVQPDSLHLHTHFVHRDEEMDGEWEAPQIPNPACETAPGCGEWKRPKINNPQYKGKWKAPLVDNPNYQVTITRPAAIRLKAS